MIILSITVLHISTQTSFNLNQYLLALRHISKRVTTTKKKDFKYVFFFLLYCRILNRDFGIFVHLVCAADVHSVIKSTNMTKNIMLEVLTLGC